MPLYAYQNGRLISAREADSSGSFSCIECRLPLKLRLGRWRIPHFFHPKKSPYCRLYSKSEDHLIAQLDIQKAFPEGELLIEQPIGKIDRIADLFWPRRQLVLEVQCSLINRGEVEQRIADYASIGYRIVWLLDDRLFNKRQLKPAEALLRSQMAFFIRCPRQGGKTEVYDQFEIIEGALRVQKSRPYPVTLPRCRHSFPLREEWIPEQLIERSKRAPLCFYGDLLSRALFAKRTPGWQGVLRLWREKELIARRKQRHVSPAVQRPFRYGIERLVQWLYTETT